MDTSTEVLQRGLKPAIRLQPGQTSRTVEGKDAGKGRVMHLERPGAGGAAVDRHGGGDFKLRGRYPQRWTGRHDGCRALQLPEPFPFMSLVQPRGPAQGIKRGSTMIEILPAASKDQRDGRTNSVLRLLRFFARLLGTIVVGSVLALFYCVWHLTFLALCMFRPVVTSLSLPGLSWFRSRSRLS
ncbi:hypothetical protein LB553_28675 [Mesorhizobium sp. CA8]|uniref:hypothetical protein n=1 Tax=unclassified Mesorhizobium TaxID=325217 RepID=UPI001CC93AA6|nr:MULTISPECIES: hypothetical protein [unclassified Mesorhizobium]MBZ9764813.1 hypothetical protein [Mesorhizobium sp. CA8]MBZ9822751.1 hypothetical protein [Mesorhizobium sp. CA4]